MSVINGVDIGFEEYKIVKNELCSPKETLIVVAVYNTDTDERITEGIGSDLPEALRELAKNVEVRGFIK